MRPIQKLDVGAVIMINGNAHTIQEIYNPYADAKAPLAMNIGEYCSYCERPVSGEALHVEHVQAKALPQYVELQYNWSNFLLACQRCNGMDNKGNQDVIYAHIHLPHLNNTLMSIQYGMGGFIRIHQNLVVGTIEYQKAKRLIELVGLDKRPGHADYLPNDKRWLKRDKVWQLAKKYEQKLQNENIDIDTIIDLAKANGFFSIWFSVFDSHIAVKSALIHAFEGTAVDCFDNNCFAILRNMPNI